METKMKVTTKTETTETMKMHPSPFSLARPDFKAYKACFEGLPDRGHCTPSAASVTRRPDTKDCIPKQRGEDAKDIGMGKPWLPAPPAIGVAPVRWYCSVLEETEQDVLTCRDEWHKCRPLYACPGWFAGLLGKRSEGLSPVWC